MRGANCVPSRIIWPKTQTDARRAPMPRRAACLAAAALLALAAPARGHAFVGAKGTAASPHALGDATADSWAVCIELAPGEAAYYSFTADARGGRPEDRLWLGTYTPGCALHNDACVERGYEFHVALWGPGPFRDCEPWPGWGAAVAPLNGTAPDAVARNGTRFAAGAGEAVTVLAAPSEPRQRPVLEPYTPTAFTPRAACVTDFPAPTGSYGLAVWGDPGASGPRHVCVGLGLAESSVFSPGNILGGAVVAWRVHRWNRWSVWSLAWPWFVLGFPALCALRSARGITVTTAPLATTALLVGALVVFAGQAIAGVYTLAWAFSITHGGAPGQAFFPFFLRVLVPLALARMCAVAALLHPRPELGQWLAVGAAVALVTGAGYVVGPLALLLALLRMRRAGAFDQTADALP